MSLDVIDAERALHQRAGLSCQAAIEAGLPGRFRTWERAGLMAVLATDPALGFLASVSGVVSGNEIAALDLVDSPDWNGVRPTMLVSARIDETILISAGLVRLEDRLLAVRRIDRGPELSTGPDVVDAGEVDPFLGVLLAGYQVDGVVADFIGAEHRLPIMRRFLLMDRDGPIAAAAMTIHGDIAVLGGASTLPAHRGKGAQPRLLQHRLRVAGEAGCSLAVATARPESVSAANLGRAGFSLHRRSAWTRA
ncbi:MAG TPA: hypothetical protein VHX59_04250 [Mycobacteriales bacterium]|jgi:GNAT superfamily N-acetyltransferase|nr:hypothetical protein [Mycobacteriales bacterium]